MYDKPEDYRTLVALLRRMKPSILLSREEWRYLEELGMRDQVRRLWEDWTACCRRSITWLMRAREGLQDPQVIAALDMAVREIAELASAP